MKKTKSKKINPVDKWIMDSMMKHDRESMKAMADAWKNTSK